MSSVIEGTVKALVEFESELEKAKAQAFDAKKRLAKDTSDWAESARTASIARAQKTAAETLAATKVEAEGQAQTIRKKGEASLKSFETSISKNKEKAAEWVLSQLLGESK